MPNAIGRPLRIALYSHDTMGLGHARRNGLIASALAGPPLEAEVLLITGTREAGTLPLPRGVVASPWPPIARTGTAPAAPAR